MLPAPAIQVKSVRRDTVFADFNKTDSFGRLYAEVG